MNNLMVKCTRYGLQINVVIVVIACLELQKLMLEVSIRFELLRERRAQINFLGALFILCSTVGKNRTEFIKRQKREIKKERKGKHELFAHVNEVHVHFLGNDINSG